MFYRGEIVLWVGNVLHHPDVGGIDEAAFCINARNSTRTRRVTFSNRRSG
jgi:N-methylhydantoinase B/oxoprolinase/acetone carboxylase alpha subunit